MHSSLHHSTSTRSPQPPLQRRETVVVVEHDLRQILADLDAHCKRPPPQFRPAGWEDYDEDDEDEGFCGVHSVGSFRAERSPRGSQRLRQRAKARVTDPAHRKEQTPARRLVDPSPVAPTDCDDGALTLRNLVRTGLSALPPPPPLQAAHGQPPPSATPRQRVSARLAHGEKVGHDVDDPDVLELCGNILHARGVVKPSSARVRRTSSVRVGDQQLVAGAERFRKSAYFCRPIRTTHPNAPPVAASKRSATTSTDYASDPDAAIAARVTSLLSAHCHEAHPDPSPAVTLRSVRLPSAPTVSKRRSGRHKISRPRLSDAVPSAAAWQK